jgi:hypothetical protein
MDIGRLLQCESCKKDLEEFIDLYEIYDQEKVDALENFAVFMEIRRLKTNQKTPFLKPGHLGPNPFNSPFETDNPYKITC